MLPFNGTITTTGKSDAIRLDKALFKLHPEFRQKAKVKAYIIGPGKLLVSLEEEDNSIPMSQEDPVLEAFLAFLDQEMIDHPERIIPLDSSWLAEAHELVKDVQLTADDVFPDDMEIF